MKRSRLTFAVAIGLVTVVGLVPMSWAAEDAAEDHQAVKVESIETAAPAETAVPYLDSCEWQSDVALEETDLIIGGIGPACLSGGPPNDCDDYPVAYGGSCECSSSLIEERCRECDSRKKGRVLETTCTVCPACYSPPCIPVPCNDFVSRTCSVS